MKASIYYPLFVMVFFCSCSTMNNKSTAIDNGDLAMVALNDEDPKIRKIATKKLTKQGDLAMVALNDEDPKIRKIATKKLTEEGDLAMIILNEKDLSVKKIAVRKNRKYQH